MFADSRSLRDMSALGLALCDGRKFSQQFWPGSQEGLTAVLEVVVVEVLVVVVVVVVVVVAVVTVVVVVVVGGVVVVVVVVLVLVPVVVVAAAAAVVVVEEEEEVEESVLVEIATCTHGSPCLQGPCILHHHWLADKARSWAARHKPSYSSKTCCVNLHLVEIGFPDTSQKLQHDYHRWRPTDCCCKLLRPLW